MGGSDDGREKETEAESMHSIFCMFEGAQPRSCLMRIVLGHVEREMLYLVPRYLEALRSARPCQSDAGIRDQTGGTVSQRCTTERPTLGFINLFSHFSCAYRFVGHTGFEPLHCACIPRQPVYTALVGASKRT
jgi:hypothetical protein